VLGGWAWLGVADAVKINASLAETSANEFGAASRQLVALGPGSHSVFAACARESRGGIGANPSTALSRKSVTQRSEVEGYPGPSARLAKRRLLFLSQRSPTG
jgi:hypothetical protein